MAETVDNTHDPAQDNTVRVLAVDDEDFSLAVYDGAFDGDASPRIEVTTCNQGDAAVELVREAREAGTPFAVAFLDVHMPPGPDGVWTAEQIRALEPDIQLVIVSGLSDLDPAEVARRAPPMDKVLFVEKPMRLRELRQYCRALGAKYRAERELRRSHAQLQDSVRERTNELERAKERLRYEIAERKRLAAAAEQVGEAIIITDADSVIQYANPAFETISGYSLREAIGRKMSLLKSGEHDIAFYAEIWATIIRGRVWKGRITNRRKDGSLVEEEMTVTPLRDASGDIVNFVAVKRDITEETKLRQLLDKAQRMEALGAMAGGIAHDFNNLLMGILGYLEIADKSLPSDSDAHLYLNEATAAGQRAKDLVRQILTFSRQTEKQRKPLNPQPIVKETLKLIRASFPKTVELRQDIPEELGQILADPGEIQQVLMNLCVNAEHAMRARGGVLSVSLENIDIDAEFESIHKDLKSGPHVVMTISDTGCGMDQVTQDSMFDPFFTTKKVGEGTGMGLAVIHGIVTSYDGAITVLSRLGEGSTFRIYLPRVDQSTAGLTPPPAPVPGGAESIMFVDDEKMVTLPAKKMLERYGYRVSVFADWREACQALRDQPDNFDLIITDQTRPNIIGSEFIEECLRIREDISIVLCTGYNNSFTTGQAHAYGIREFIIKPFFSRELAEVVRRALDRRKKD